jgi:hypothetical protein
MLHGRRVTLEQWRDANPLTPTYLRTADGERITVHPGDDRTEPLVRAGLIRAAREEGNDARRMAVIADVLTDERPTGPITFGIQTPESPPMPWLVGVPDEDDDAPVPGEVIAIALQHEPVEVSRTEGPAEQWSKKRGLPKHKKTRHSQTPEGRRARYLRQKAERLGVSIKSVEQTTRRNRTPNPKEAKP